MITLLRILHIAAGSIVLASMFVPAVTRKGSAIHRRAGWVFVVSMAIVSISAVVLSSLRLLYYPERQMSALFLGYLGILTGAAASNGVRAIRTKRRTGANRHWWDLGLNGALGLGGIGLFAYGLRVGEPLLIVFSIVGGISAAAELRYWLRPPASKMHWWFEHMNAMLAGCIGGTTAFLVQLGGYFDNGWSLVLWLAPTVIGVPAIAIWNVYYHRAFAGTATITAAPGLNPVEN